MKGDTLLSRPPRDWMSWSVGAGRCALGQCALPLWASDVRQQLLFATVYVELVT